MPFPTTWTIRGRELSLARPLVMGIVNVTPDSFSDGGRFLSPGAALAHAAKLVAEGVDILDIGGESTRPQGAELVSADEELRRVLPVIRTLAAERPEMVLSVDTVKAAVAEAALAAGAHIVNDVSGMRLDPDMAPVCAAGGAGVVVMHSRGGVSDMSTFDHAEYGASFLDEMFAELAERVRAVHEAGVARDAIAVDPGIGFAKRAGQSLRALACLGRLAAWGYPVVVGASRKRFIGELTGQANASHRVYGSVGAAVSAFERGAHVLRVHDVAATRYALDVAAAIRDAAAESDA
ncbi:MAG TPA: dihydropteroate synthase [Gemmatimonadaceae bacterium]|nr:dihydropteroate synthase [Gemmatimonadaceae bacterium]